MMGGGGEHLAVGGVCVYSGCLTSASGMVVILEQMAELVVSKAHGLWNNLCTIIEGLPEHLCEACEIIFQLALSLIVLEAPLAKAFCGGNLGEC